MIFVMVTILLLVLLSVDDDENATSLKKMTTTSETQHDERRQRLKFLVAALDLVSILVIRLERRCVVASLRRHALLFKLRDVIWKKLTKAISVFVERKFVRGQSRIKSKPLLPWLEEWRRMNNG